MSVCHPAEHACSVGSWRQSLGASSFDNSNTHAEDMLCHCGTCQNTSKPLPARTWLVPETGRRGMIQGTRKSGMARISHWALQGPSIYHPWPSQCHAHGCALPACPAQPPLLCWRLQPPQLHSRLGNPAPSRKRISMVPDNIHCKKLTLLQWVHPSLPDLRQCCTGIDCFLKTAKKRYFALN